MPLIETKPDAISQSYAAAVFQAGGLPLLLPVPRSEHRQAAVTQYLDLCDGLVLTGGFDPITERYGQTTDPRVTREHPDRQAFEESLLDALVDRPEFPVLGICLGMQLMALHAGGTLNQWMSDSVESHAVHYDDHTHRIIPEVTRSPVSEGEVTSWHRQCMIDAGAMRVVARAEDGVIEAIDDPARHCYLGVQWHPERTASHALGLDLFRELIARCSPRSGS
jgi:putative glutamine amidotransferase